jgi:hypothetical protein
MKRRRVKCLEAVEKVFLRVILSVAKNLRWGIINKSGDSSSPSAPQKDKFGAFSTTGFTP